MSAPGDPMRRSTQPQAHSETLTFHLPAHTTENEFTYTKEGEKTEKIIKCSQGHTKYPPNRPRQSSHSHANAHWKSKIETRVSIMILEGINITPMLYNNMYNYKVKTMYNLKGKKWEEGNSID